MGTVTIDFGKTMAVPRSYSSFNDAVLAFGLITEEAGSRRNLLSKKITYQKFKITSFTSRRMVVQVQFEDPASISRSQVRFNANLDFKYRRKTLWKCRYS